MLALRGRVCTEMSVKAQSKSDRVWMSGGAREGIVTVGNPTLRQTCAEVECSDETSALCSRLVERLREFNAAGLASNQVGINKRIVVVEVRKTDLFPDRPESGLFVMLNPVIIELSGETVEDWEGCFSVPGMMGKVPRAERCRVQYMTPEGEEQTLDFEGYVARVVQHEIDHLDGHVFVDRMQSTASLCTVENYMKYIHGKMVQ